MTVGVPRETIMQDYLLTGTYAAETLRRIEANLLDPGSAH